jgi:hypothetical protein
MTPAAKLLPNFTRQIPPQSVVSASAAIHPHLAHRRVIYTFPTVQEADYVLVDVTDIPGVHPNDTHTKIMEMLKTDWQLLKAEYGLILAKKTPNTAPPCSPSLPLPCDFYNFVQATTTPTYPVSLAFGDGRLQLLGYDIHDDPDDGVSFRFYWQTSDTLPEDLHLWPLIYDDIGQLLHNPAQIPMIATIWYPPSAWQPNEIIVTETLPQLLPDSFHLGIAVGTADSLTSPQHRAPIVKYSDPAILYPGHWAQLASFERKGPFLLSQPPRLTHHPLTTTEVQFGPAIHLTGFWLDALQPGSALPVLLEWRAKQSPQTDYTVFLHLIAPDGTLVAQHDAYPTWLTPQPTSQWPLNRPILDRHLLTLPSDLPPGKYRLQIGIYNAQTMERLTCPDGSDTFTLAQIDLN